MPQNRSGISSSRFYKRDVNTMLKTRVWINCLNTLLLSTKTSQMPLPPALPSRLTALTNRSSAMIEICCIGPVPYGSLWKHVVIDHLKRVYCNWGTKYLRLLNFNYLNFNCYMWLVATTLDKAALKGKQRVPGLDSIWSSWEWGYHTENSWVQWA